MRMKVMLLGSVDSVLLSLVVLTLGVTKLENWVL
jgi:hypothetical protein